MKNKQTVSVLACHIKNELMASSIGEIIHGNKTSFHEENEKVTIKFTCWNGERFNMTLDMWPQLDHGFLFKTGYPTSNVEDYETLDEWLEKNA